MGGLTIGIDIGTTSVKGVLATEQGEVLRRTRVPHGALVTTPDRLEHDAGRAWRRGPRRVLRELVNPDVEGVAVAAMVPSLTAVNPRGVPQTAGLLYGDARGRTVDPNAKSGTGGEAIGFLSWTAQQARDAAGYWPAQAVANHALAGVGVMDNASAAACYPLYDGMGWAAGQLERLGVEPGQMPIVAGFCEPAAEVGGAVLASGLVDAIGEQVVAGADTPGDVLVICGSTLITWVVVDEWREVPGLLCIPHTTAGLFLLGGPSNAGGLFLDWVRRLTGGRQNVEELAPERIPVWEPYPRGERTPLEDPHRRASMTRLDFTHGPAAVQRAAREAAGFVVRRLVDRAGVRGRRAVDVSGSPDGAARGAAFVARMAAGLESDLARGSRWARTGRQVHPDPRWIEAVDSRYELFTDLAG